MKKSEVMFVFLFLGSLIFSVSSVSAYYLPSFGQVGHEIVYTVTDFFEPVLNALFGSYSSGYIFETLLLFILIASMVFIALKKVPIFQGHAAIIKVLTIAISLLSIRWIDYEWFTTVMSTYKLLGIVLTSILPFILYFYFLYSAAEDNDIIRKAGWLFWIIIYTGLWTSEYTSTSNSIVYFWTLVTGVACLLLDGVINRRLKAIKNIQKDQYFANREIGRLNMQIFEVQEQLARGAIDKKTAEKTIKELKSHIEWLRKQ
ncbi:MAG TPA: hypothetical protein VHA12_02105 [Candidatus Nanoarchaeia archaeon]|nr:hypothetical protein [Candidatus Nanoarchaeia archaeon]